MTDQRRGKDETKCIIHYVDCYVQDVVREKRDSVVLTKVKADFQMNMYLQLQAFYGILYASGIHNVYDRNLDFFHIQEITSG